MPMKMYARKFIMLPIMPSVLLPISSGWFFQMTPIGAARLVTNEIIA